MSNLYPVVYQLNSPDYNPGLFSVFFSVIGALNFYEKKMEDCTGLIVDFENQGLYHDMKQGPNWWTYYFEPINLGHDKSQPKKFPYSKHSEFACLAAEMPSQQGHELIKKYVKLKPHMQKKIDQFVHDNFKGHRVIGVHYRGTDKIIEAPTVSYDVIIRLIKNEIQKDTTTKIFIATDEEKFLHVMKHNFPGKIIALNALRSKQGYPVHYPSNGGFDNYKKGEDAIMDCILLSKCSKLIRTSSNLSAAATHFNPSMEVVLLSRGIHDKE